MAPEVPILSSLASLFVCFVLVLGFYAFRRPDERRYLLPLALLAFSVKCLLVVTYFYLLVWYGEEGFAYKDARGHHDRGAIMAIEIKEGLPRDSLGWKAKDTGYYVLTAVMYIVFGENPLVPRFFNCLFASMTLLYIFRMAFIYYGERVARLATLLVAIFPWETMIFINHRKDAVIQLLAMMILYRMIMVLRGGFGSVPNMAWMIAGLIAIEPLRGDMLPFFFATFAICYAFQQRNMAQAVVSLAIGGIASIIVILVAREGFVTSVLDTTQTLQHHLEGSASRIDRMAGGGGLVAFARMDSIFDIYKLPLATFLITILPFPPSIRFDHYLPSLIGSWAQLFTLAFYPHMIVGLRSLILGGDLRNRLPIVVYPILVFVLVGATHLGLLRYRCIAYPLIMIWAADGWYRGASFPLKVGVYGLFAFLGLVVTAARFT